MTARIGTLAALLAAVAYSQTAEQSLPLANVNSQDGIQQMINVLHAVRDLAGVTYDSSAKALIVHGTPAELALAQWLVVQLDKPAGWQPPQGPVAYTYQPPAGPDSIDTAVRVFYLTQANSPSDIQEFQYMMRTGADIRRAVPYLELRALVVRGAPERIALAEWVVQQLDQPAQSGRPTAAFQYQSPDPRDAAASTVRILYLNHTNTPAGLQQAIQVVRTGSDTARVIPLTSRTAMLIRAEPERVALAEWFVQQIDLPPQPGRKPASYRYQSPDSAVRVYYPLHAATQQALMTLVYSLRTNAKVTRVFPCDAPQAIAFRGTTETVAAAEKLLAAADQSNPQ